MPAPWCSALAVVPADEKADAALLEAHRRLVRPLHALVALDAPDGLLLDITGAAHLFGGEAAMLTLVRGKIAAQGFAVRAAIAGTSLAARALARFAAGHHRRAGREAEADGAACRWRRWIATTRSRRALRRAGLKTIGQVAARQRSELAARLGKSFRRPAGNAAGRARTAARSRAGPCPT